MIGHCSPSTTKQLEGVLDHFRHSLDLRYNEAIALSYQLPTSLERHHQVRVHNISYTNTKNLVTSHRKLFRNIMRPAEASAGLDHSLHRADIGRC